MWFHAANTVSTTARRKAIDSCSVPTYNKQLHGVSESRDKQTNNNNADRNIMYVVPPLATTYNNTLLLPALLWDRA